MSGSVSDVSAAWRGLGHQPQMTPAGGQDGLSSVYSDDHPRPRIKKRYGEAVIATDPKSVPGWEESDSSGDELDGLSDLGERTLAKVDLEPSEVTPSPRASVRSMSFVSGTSGMTAVRDKGEAALRGYMRSQDWDTRRVLAHGDSFLMQLRDPWAKQSTDASQTSTPPQSPTQQLLASALNAADATARIDGMVAHAAKKVAKKTGSPLAAAAGASYAAVPVGMGTLPRRKKVRMSTSLEDPPHHMHTPPLGTSGRMDDEVSYNASYDLSASLSTRRPSMQPVTDEAAQSRSAGSPVSGSGAGVASASSSDDDNHDYREVEEEEEVNMHDLDVSQFAALPSGEGFLRDDGVLFPAREWAESLAGAKTMSPGTVRPPRPMTAPLAGPARRLQAARAHAADDSSGTRRCGSAASCRDLRSDGTKGIHSPSVAGFQVYMTSEMDASTLRPTPIPGEGAASQDWAALAQLLVPAPRFDSPFMLNSSQEKPGFNGRKSLPPAGKGSFCLKHIDLRWMVPRQLRTQSYLWSASGGRSLKMEKGWRPAPPERWHTLANFGDHAAEMLRRAADKKAANFGSWAPNPNPEHVHLINSPRSTMVLLKRGVNVEELLEPDAKDYPGSSLAAERASRAVLLENLQEEYALAAATVRHGDIYEFFREHWPQRLATSCALSSPANEYKKKPTNQVKPLSFFNEGTNVFTARHASRVVGMHARIAENDSAKSQRMKEHFATIANSSAKFQQKKAEEQRRHRQDKREARESWYRRKNMKLNQEGFAKARFLSRHLNVTAAATQAELAKEQRASYAQVGSFKITDDRHRHHKVKKTLPGKGSPEKPLRKVGKRPLGVPVLLNPTAAAPGTGPGTRQASRSDSLAGVKPQFVFTAGD